MTLSQSSQGNFFAIIDSLNRHEVLYTIIGNFGSVVHAAGRPKDNLTLPILQKFLDERNQQDLDSDIEPPVRD